MKKIVLVIWFMMAVALSGIAQRGSNAFIIAAEAGLPTGDFNNYKTGIGVSGKLLLGIEEHSHVSISSGYSSFKMKGSTDAYKVKTSIIPALVGYRYNLRPLYLEPQIGLGIYGVKTKVESGGTETTSSSSKTAFTWALGGGLDIANIDLGVRYQMGHRKGGSVGFFGLHLGYDLFGRDR